MRSVLAFLRRFATLSVLLLMCAALSLLSPYFLNLNNLLNVVSQSAINGVLAVGLTLVIITGGIDLSVGSMLALSGIVLGHALHAGTPFPLACLAALLAGSACGAFNGLVITRFNLPPFIATLGMMSVARGLGLLFSDGRPITGFGAGFRVLGAGDLLGMPVSVLIGAGVYVLAHFGLRYHQEGRHIYAIGGNREAARLSGIRVNRTLMLVYTASGLLSGLAAIILTARLNSAQPIAGIAYELDAIAAAVIGGTSLSGGEGSVIGTAIGALIISVLRNGLNLLDVSSSLQQVVIGFVIIVAVVLDRLVHRR